MSDLTKISAGNHTEMLKHIAPFIKKRSIHKEVEDFDCETVKNLPASTQTPQNQKRLLLKLPR